MDDTLMVAALAGLALATALIACSRLVMELGSAETIYRDRPPRVFYWLWPLVNIMGNSFGFLMRKDREAALRARLRKAGQEYALTTYQFFGGKLVGALVGAAFGASVATEGTGFIGAMLGGFVGYIYPELWLRDHTKRRNLAVLKALPFFLDIVTLSIESGLNLSGALQKAVDKCKPGPLIVEINRVLRDVRAGKPRLDALRDLADRMDYAPISSLVSALVQGELMGTSLGPILRAQSDQRRLERFQRAEKLAMEAPVKMLAPLIIFIFPCTFVVLGFPIVMKFLGSGY